MTGKTQWGAGELWSACFCNTTTTTGRGGAATQPEGGSPEHERPATPLRAAWLTVPCCHAHAISDARWTSWFTASMLCALAVPTACISAAANLLTPPTVQRLPAATFRQRRTPGSEQVRFRQVLTALWQRSAAPPALSNNWPTPHAWLQIAGPAQVPTA